MKGPNELARDAALSEQMKSPEWVEKRAPEFKRGRSANPGGRPASLPRFRKAARENSFTIMAEIMRRISNDSAGEIPLKDLVTAFQELSDRGGHIKSKDEADVDATKARIVLTAMAFEGLTPEQRMQLLTALKDA
jgi:hypothetical protein